MEISFKDILRIIKKNIIFIIILSVLFSAAAYLYTTFFVKKTYTSTVELYVSADYKTNSGYEDLYAYNYSSKLVATCIGLLDTNNFYTDVAKALNNKYSPSELKSKVQFTAIQDTELFKADVTSGSPAEAKSIADAVAKTAPVTVSEILSNNSKLKIVDRATLPQHPNSPNSMRNVMLAFLAGVVISLVIAFVRDYFDVKIKYDDEMTTINNVPVLAAIPDFEKFSQNRKTAQTSKKA